VLFPLAKIGILLLAWARMRRGGRASTRLVGALQALGRWSMLDVFVVALVIFAIKARSFGDAHVAIAIYPFVASIALTGYAGLLVKRALSRSGASAVRPKPDECQE
jgi:paraquat-inducible protein A